MLRKISLLILLIVSQVCAYAAPSKLATDDQAQIVATAERFFALSYPEATCIFSDVGENGKYVDARVYDVGFRQREYERVFKSLLSANLYQRLKPLCLKKDQWGMIDFRANDDGLASEPEAANNVAFRLTRAIQVEPRPIDKATARVYWSELPDRHSKKVYAFGRTDLVFVKEHGLWLIDDAYVYNLGPDISHNGELEKLILNETTMEFENGSDNASLMHLRDLPISCGDAPKCK